MALRVAIASGNWSNPAIWNAGLKPVAGDIAASNGFTITIDENCNVDLITNIAQSPVKATPNMTGYTTPSGIVTASSENTPGRNAWLAFDGNGGTIGQLATANTGWIAYEFPTPIVINLYSWGTGGNENPQNWTFEGWNGSSWVVLHTVTGGPTGGYTSPLIGNNTAYIKYRINVTQTNTTAQRPLWYEINLFEKGSEISSVAGGTFILNSGITVTTVNGVSASNLTCLTYSGSGTSTIIGSINALTVTPGTYSYTLVHNGSGTLNITGNLNANFGCSNRGCLNFTGSGILNVTGNVYGGFCNSPNVDVSGTGTMNVVGYVEGGSNVTALNVAGNARVNITGNIGGGSNTGRGVTINGANTITTITGNLVLGLGGGSALFINAAGNVTLTGSVGDVTSAGTISLLNTNSVGCYLKIIGTIYAGNGVAHVNSLGSGAINIFTGPFISSVTGTQPFSVARMHYQRTMGSYYEFRDNSTNGALPPIAPAPATRLVSPDTVANSPIPANVRQGVVYAAGSQTGTMIVPSRDNVAKGVLVDNTTGTAVLDADAIWAVPLTSINTLNSIGRRVKNAATVETTAAQIQTTLNNNP